MPRSSLVSRARNREDVVLLRALGHRVSVRYALLASDVDAAATWTLSLQSAGWTGEHLAVSHEPESVDAALASLRQGDAADLQVLWTVVPQHAALIFPALIRAAVRPSVVLVECADGTGPDVDASAVDAGYTAHLFDGMTTFYLAEGHSELSAALSYPSCTRDDFVTYAEFVSAERGTSLVREVIHWRGLAVTAWADAVASALVQVDDRVAAGDAVQLAKELAAMRATLSWRVTRPIRALRRLLSRIRPLS